MLVVVLTYFLMPAVAALAIYLLRKNRLRQLCNSLFFDKPLRRFAYAVLFATNGIALSMSVVIFSLRLYGLLIGLFGRT